MSVLTVSPSAHGAKAPARGAITYEAFIHDVRAIVAVRIADPETHARLLDAQLVYGGGEHGTRGVCYFEAWQNGRRHDFLGVCATGEESATLLASTTTHELAHCLAARAVTDPPGKPHAQRSGSSTLRRNERTATAPKPGR